MNIMQLFGWLPIDKCNPKRSGYYKVCDVSNRKNWASYNKDTDTWCDCTLDGMEELVYWKEETK